MSHAFGEGLAVRAFESVLQPSVFETTEQVRAAALTEFADRARSAAGTPPASAAGSAVEHDVEALLAERDSFKDIALRLQADFENYRKRVATQQADEIDRATGKLADSLLPVLDDLERGAPVAGSVLVERLLDAGAIHPTPASTVGRYTVDDVTVVTPQLRTDAMSRAAADKCAGERKLQRRAPEDCQS